jgi:hypothetical protein
MEALHLTMALVKLVIGNLQTEILQFFGIQVKLITFLTELWGIKELEKTKMKAIHLA